MDTEMKKPQSELSDETIRDYEMFKKQLISLSDKKQSKNRIETYTNFKFVYKYKYKANKLVEVKVTNYETKVKNGFSNFNKN